MDVAAANASWYVNVKNKHSVNTGITVQVRVNTRFVVGYCRGKAKKIAGNAAKKAAKKAVLVKDDAAKDAARKEWSSFGFGK